MGAFLLSIITTPISTIRKYLKVRSFPRSALDMPRLTESELSIVEISRILSSQHQKISFLLETLGEIADRQEEMVIVISGIKFVTPNRLTIDRARTLFIKEPETIRWIDGFNDGDVFWDIGANVGVFSLYAANTKSLRVLAFEPSAFNYHVLNRNILLNNAWGKILSYCISFSEDTSIGILDLSTTEIGGALHSFKKRETESSSQPALTYKQGSISFSIDEFVNFFRPPLPTHVKIDVDGLELEILRGAPKTFSNKKLRSLSVELNTNQQDHIKEATALLGRCGLKFESRDHAHADSLLYNYIFTRP